MVTRVMASLGLTVNDVRRPKLITDAGSDVSSLAYEILCNISCEMWRSQTLPSSLPSQAPILDINITGRNLN